MIGCTDQTRIQSNYNSDRDTCRADAEARAQTLSGTDDKEKKGKLVTLFADCMADRGWTVPGGTDKSAPTKVAEAPRSGPQPLLAGIPYEGAGATLMAAAPQPQAPIQIASQAQALAGIAPAAGSAQKKRASKPKTRSSVKPVLSAQAELRKPLPQNPAGSQCVDRISLKACQAFSPQAASILADEQFQNLNSVK